MSNEEDWRGKFERSEAARQKLRETLVLLKEKALNTEQLLNQNTELKQELAAEKKAKQRAQNAASKLKVSNEGMQKRVSTLEDQVAQLQNQMAIVLNQQHPGATAASGSAVLDIVTRTEMTALKSQVTGLEKQLNIWNKAMKEVQHQPSGQKTSAAAAAPVEEDPTRARAVAMLQTNKPHSAPVPKFLAAAGGGGGGAKKALARESQREKQQEQQQQPPKKRVRLNEDLQQQQQHQMLIGGSAGGSEAAPPGFADVAIAALRAVMGADAEQPPSVAAVEDAVRILGPLGITSVSNGGISGSTISSQKRNIVAAFSCAVLECAAASPARHFAAGSLSPRRWFESPVIDTAAAKAQGKKVAKSVANKSSKITAAIGAKDSIEEEKGKGDRSSRPSFLGVWCSSDVLLRHSLPWLLYCAVEISSANTITATPTAPDEEERLASSSAIVQAAPVEYNICDVLAQDLAKLVVKDVLPSSVSSLGSTVRLHTPTELCAAASAAAALWRSQGDFRSFQTFILDILLSKLDSYDAELLPPVAAALESWPEALPPNKGALGSGLHGVLQHACHCSERSRVLEIRLAATWVRKIGVEEWGWSEELSGNDEEMEALGAEARKQLEKFGASSLAALKNL